MGLTWSLHPAPLEAKSCVFAYIICDNCMRERCTTVLHHSQWSAKSLNQTYVVIGDCHTLIFMQLGPVTNLHKSAEIPLSVTVAHSDAKLSF